MSARVLTIGETMGLTYNEQPGTLASSRVHHVSFGGAESNVAIALRRLGTPVTWLSRVGDDPIGELIARELGAEGVDVRAPVDGLRPTGFMHKLRRTAKTSTVTFWRAESAASALSEKDLTDDLFDGVALVHLTGILPGVSESARACVLAAARRARAAGILLSFDVNHRARVWGERDPRPTYLELAELSDIIFAGDEEAAMLVEGTNPRELADAMTALGPKQAVVKLGADGALASVHGETYEQPAYRVEAVDTVGAGDAFVAGYLSSLLAWQSPQARLDRAAAAGAFACLSLGDWEGAPTQRELGTLSAREGVTR